MNIITRKEAQTQGLHKFFTGKPCKRGHIAERTVSKYMCVECQKILSKNYASANEEKLANQRASWYRENKEKMSEYNKAYLIANRVRINENLARYRKENPDKIKIWARNYRESAEGRSKRESHWISYSSTRRCEINARNRDYYSRVREAEPWKINEYAAKRRADREQATPNWASRDKIRQIYMLAASRGEEVDHIIPLKSKLVCGLHVEFNLRVVPMSENRRKSNKFNPEEHYVRF